MSPHRVSLRSSILFILIASLAWSVSPVLSRSIREYFSVPFQNFFRFGVSLLILWLFTRLRLGQERIRSELTGFSRLFPKLLGLTIFVFLHQMLDIAAIYELNPALAALLAETNILFTIVLAYILFHDERGTIRNPLFRTGLVLALAGVVTVILAGADLTEGNSGIGVLYIILSALSWSFFTVFTRKWIPHLPPSLSTSVFFTINTALFALTVFLFQEGSFIPGGVPLQAWLTLGISGLLGVGVGYSFYFAALPGTGVTLASSLCLIIPLLTAVSSYLLLGELLLPVQIIGGVGLLAGCFLIVRSRYGE